MGRFIIILIMWNSCIFFIAGQIPKGTKNILPYTSNVNSNKTNISSKSSFLTVKSNLLFDAATFLNLELEVPFNNKWSIAADYIFPWWSLKRKNYYIQSLSGNIELKRWLGDRTRKPKLCGIFIGVYGGLGYYDFEFGKDGYQGEFYIPIGLEFGGAHRINKHFRLEYGLGIAFLRSNYKRYLPEDKCKVWQNDGKQTYFGPTRLRVSLCWDIPWKIKKGEVYEN